MIPLWENTSEEEIAKKQEDFQGRHFSFIPGSHSFWWEEAEKMKFEDAVQILQEITTPPAESTSTSTSSSSSQRPTTSSSSGTTPPRSSTSGFSGSDGYSSSRPSKTRDEEELEELIRLMQQAGLFGHSSTAAEDKRRGDEAQQKRELDKATQLREAHGKLETIFGKKFTTSAELDRLYRLWIRTNHYDKEPEGPGRVAATTLFKEVGDLRDKTKEYYGWANTWKSGANPDDDNHRKAEPGPGEESGYD